MRGFKAFAFAATASVLLAGSLQAQGVTPGHVEWNWFNTTTQGHSWYNPDGRSRVGPLANDYFRSPYRARLDMGSGFGSVVDIFCVDFGHWSNTGTYDAFFTNLGSGAGSLGTTTRSANLNDYLAAAWLGSQMVKPTSVYAKVGPNGLYYNENQLRLMQGAMWQIMSGEPMYVQLTDNSWTTDAGGTAPWVNTWVGWATTGAAGMNPYEWAVVTERGDNGGLGVHQEYITQVTPEPATMLLLGTGLVVMLMAAGALRRPTA